MAPFHDDDYLTRNDVLEMIDGKDPKAAWLRF